MVQKHLQNLYPARTAWMLSGARRVAMTLLMMLLTMTAQTAWADTGYNYKGADGTMRNTYTDDHIPDDWVTVLTDGTSYLSEGWNYVSGNINLTNGISVSTPQAETDHYFQLILADGASLTINLESSSCISIGERCSLTIYGQTNGTGTLNVTSQNYSHAIEGGTGSSITLYGGIINANAGGSNCGIYVNNIYLAGATVYASSYGGNVSASCKYKDSDNNEYEGSIYDTGAIAGKTLTPFGTVASTSVMLDPQGGSGGTESVTVTNGAAMPTITPPTRTGYTFGGYYDGMDGAGTKYYNADGSSANNWNHTGESFVLSAKWTAKTYTVTLEANGGSGGTTSVTATYGADMPSATMPTWDDHTFNGYFADDGTQYYNADGTSTRKWNIDASTTLNANWNQEVYNITYVLYDGTNNENNPATYTYESENITLAAPTAPENSGYTFGGWYTDADFSTPVSSPAIPQGSTGEKTFYAKWLTTVTVTVNWNDANNQDGKRPESVVVKLLANSEEDEEVTVTKPEGNPNSWTGTAVSKPVHKAGAPIVYTWAMANEKIPTGYTFGIDVENATLNLTHEPEKTEAKVNVAWDDADNQDGIRPESVTVTLSNGTEVTLNEENSWTATVEHLPKYANGEEIVYTWTEDEEGLPEGYELTDTSVNGTVTTLTNSHTPEETEVKVTKVWDDSDNQDGKRPDDVTVNLLADGRIIETVTLSEENSWTYTWTNLDKYNGEGAIDYTVTEEAVAEYTTNITKADDGTFTYTVTNSHETEETEATVEVAWEDADDQDGKRPTSLTVTLSDGTEVTLDEGNSWTATVGNLPKYANGEEIEYTWSLDEEGLPEGYELTDTSVDGIVTKLTISYMPEETSVMANVVWSDGNNTEGFRPETVTINLKKGEMVMESVQLNVSNNWSYTWTGLPTHEGGEAITYTVTEDAVDNYSTTIEGFTITNSRTVEMTTATLNIIWLDDTNKYGVRPASLNAKLSDGTNETPYIINENLLNGIYFSFIVNNLQKYINGTEIVYSLTITDEIDCYEQTGLDKNGNTTSYTMQLMTMGNCGQTGSEAALIWEYNTAEKTLYIIGSGQMMYYNSVQNGESWSNGAPWKAFANEIEHVVINDGITYVGSNTFAHCPSISSVTLPTDQQLYQIGPGAFADCTSLTNIDIPMSVNDIGDGAFAGCSSLATVSIGYGDPGTFTLGSEVFPVTTTILVPESAYENYIKEKAVNGQSEEIDNPFYGYKNKIVPATRTFFANGTNTWMTWCDKYAWTLPEGCTAYTISDVSGSTVTLSDALTTIPAYTPVLIQRDANVTAPVTAAFSAVGTVPDSGYDSATGIASTTDTEGCTFYGTTTALETIPEADYSAGLTYVLYGDKFIKADTNEGIAANRCWLKLEAGGGTSGARLLSIVIDDNPTAIDNVQWSMVNGQSDSWYTIDGRKLDGKPTKKGLYIYNGKKVAIK